MSLSDSDYYEPSYSADERIEKMIAKDRQKIEKEKKKLDKVRKFEFENFFAQKEQGIFNLPGLKFIKFTHNKIIINIIPSDIRNFISKRLCFTCTLKYNVDLDLWYIKKDTFPANHKLLIHRNFTRGFVNDEELLNAIIAIYNYFEKWAEEEEERNLRMKKLFLEKKILDIELTSEEEELFLTEEERNALFLKRQAILKRMIPPTIPREIPPETPPRRAKHVKKVRGKSSQENKKRQKKH